MKKKTPYLDFYRASIKTGRIERPGLCCHFRNGAIKLFEPDCANHYDLWAYDGDIDPGAEEDHQVDEICHSFGPLRQTIVLFLAAMNNEL